MNDWNYLGQHHVDFEKTDILMSPSFVGMASATVRPFAHMAGSLSSAYLTWNGKYVGRQFYDNTSSLERSIPAYFVADLSLGYEVALRRSFAGAQDDKVGAQDDKAGTLAFSFHVNNLFNNLYYADAWLWRAYFQQEDTFYAETGIYPQAPMNFMFKVAWRF